jgi:hypothetical protein
MEPDKATDCGDPVASLSIMRVAVSVPVAVGLYSTVTVQLAPAARVGVADVKAGQVVAVGMKEAALVPEVARLVIWTAFALAPVFLIVTVCVALVVPTAVLVNTSEVGDTVSSCGVRAAPHALTRLVTFMEPRPVAMS